MSILHFIIQEHCSLYRFEDFGIEDRQTMTTAQFLPNSIFNQLKSLAFKLDADPIFGLSVLKNKEVLRTKNYVGILQLPDGTQIEILPKIAQSDTIVATRKGLLQMIKSLPNVPFRTLSAAAMNQTKLPLWEIFISIFVEEVEKLTRQGIQKNYDNTTAYQPFLRGKWLPQYQNAANQAVFYVSFDEFMMDILPNRLLKTCLLYLEEHSNDVRNQAKLRQLRFIFEEVKTSQNIHADFEKISHLDRRFERYQTALHWAKTLLNQQAWAGTGTDTNTSLLFPTQRLFEAYITRGFRQYIADYEVFIQDSSHFLIHEHVGKQQFRLRPDIVLKKQQQVVVIDIKWKWISPKAPNYGIEQADLYQLYVYGQKYQAQELLLIYPAHAEFQAPLAIFNYDEQLKLRVVPFDITNSLGEEMDKIQKLLLTFSHS